MKHVGMFDAKTQLSRLIDKVEKGEEVMITRHGKPVAKLVPASTRRPALTPEQVEKRRQALNELLEIGRRLNLNLTHEEIKKSIEEGRR
jgi:prevent-host-death family protein